MSAVRPPGEDRIRLPRGVPTLAPRSEGPPRRADGEHMQAHAEGEEGVARHLEHTEAGNSTTLARKKCPANPFLPKGFKDFLTARVSMLGSKLTFLETDLFEYSVQLFPRDSQGLYRRSVLPSTMHRNSSLPRLSAEPLPSTPGVYRRCCCQASSVPPEPQLEADPVVSRDHRDRSGRRS